MDAMRSAPAQRRLIALMTRREIRSKLTSFWFFVVASAVCLIAFVYGSGFQETFVTESVLVTTDPLMPLNTFVFVFLGLVLGLRLATSLSWEREHRTLEVLLVGPVRWSAVIVAKFVVELGVLALLIAIYLAYLYLGQPLGAGVIGATDLLSMSVTPLFVLPVMAMGLLVSAWARSVRAAVVGYLVVIGLLSAFALVLGILEATPPDQMSLSSVYIKAGLEEVAKFLAPVSPVSLLARAINQLFLQNPIQPMEMISAMLLTAGLILAALFVARVRGVQA